MVVQLETMKMKIEDAKKTPVKHNKKSAEKRGKKNRLHTTSIQKMELELEMCENVEKKI